MSTLITAVISTCAGALFMALVHEVGHWDARRRLAVQLAARRPAAAGAAPGPDRLDDMVASYRAGRDALMIPPVSPYAHPYARPSSMLPPRPAGPPVIMHPQWDGNGTKLTAGREADRLGLVTLS